MAALQVGLSQLPVALGAAAATLGALYTGYKFVLHGYAPGESDPAVRIPCPEGPIPVELTMDRLTGLFVEVLTQRGHDWGAITFPAEMQGEPNTVLVFKPRPPSGPPVVTSQSESSLL